MVRVLMLVLALGWAGYGKADTLEVLHSFAGADGANPYAGLLMDGADNLYGTTVNGGANGSGVVFQLTPNENKTAWTETVLHSFCSQSDCSDGANPYFGLVMDGAGNLYGTAANGGATGNGVVFRLSPNADKTAWSQTVLYSFGSQAEAADGLTPLSGLIMDGAGNLYGVTNGGGANGGGVVFQLTPNENKTAWTETVLYSFCQSSACADGVAPYSGLVMDDAGSLYGTTPFGGANDEGTVFRLTPNEDKTAWSQTVLYSFGSQPDGADGYWPLAGPIIDSAGNLYGTTFYGGANGSGVVFQLTPNENKTVWSQTPLYSFGSQTDGADGLYPNAVLIMDGAGNLYGTTTAGGIGVYSGSGVVFQLTPNENKTAWTQTVLHTFCSQRQRLRCLDGRIPYSSLIMDEAGTLYGTTSAGGTVNGPDPKQPRAGVVFALKPN